MRAASKVAATKRGPVCEIKLLGTVKTAHLTIENVVEDFFFISSGLLS